MNEYYISVTFENNPKNYYFSCSNPENIKKGSYVVVETTIGKEIGKVVTDPNLIEELDFDREIKPIIRLAMKRDLELNEENKKLAKEAQKIFAKSIENLKLEMRLLDSMYTLDRTKILFTYASDERIDFRELLKILASQLHCRIELRQVSSRERAQIIGGIGLCGLPLCCSFFSSGFEGISLNRAKNQMLAINIPKLSGQCGKLMCCLKYEDDNYTELKKEFPSIGTILTYEDQQYKVTGFNVFSKIVKIENENNVEFVPLEELNPSKNQKKFNKTPTNTISVTKEIEENVAHDEKNNKQNKNNNENRQKQNNHHNHKQHFMKNKNHKNRNNNERK